MTDFSRTELSVFQGFYERTVTVEVGQRAMGVKISGYGEATMIAGHGTPIWLDLSEDEPKLYVWADINEEDPTHVIPLDGAREDRRNEQE